MSLSSAPGFKFFQWKKKLVCFTCNKKVASELSRYIRPVKWHHRKKVLISVAVMLAIAVALAIGLGVGLGVDWSSDDQNLPVIIVKDGVFRQGAVVSDSQTCSDIGVDMLSRNGSAVDAAIATLLCTGLFVAHSMGIGGGHFMTIYDRLDRRSIVIDARETAPAAATEDMYHGDPTISQRGILASGVPGEVKGYLEAHRLYGKLEWKELFQPAIRLARSGVRVENALAKALAEQENAIKADPGLRQIFINNATGHVLRENDFYTNPQLADTLQAIADNGGDEFYKGTIAKNLVSEITAKGGIITEADLASYEANVTEALSIDLSGGLRVHSVPPPGSGAVLDLSMLVLDGYGFNSSSIADDESSALTYHRIVESFKFGYAHRTFLGDPHFVDITELVANMTSPEYAQMIRDRIDDNATHPAAYYGANVTDVEDHGTSQVSVIAPNGDAVSITSTVNLYFGSAVRSLTTGIILNDQMDDFSSPNTTNYFGVPASESNYIVAGKRPMSSMTPSVFVDKDGKVLLVAGAAGGTRITTATALTAIRYLWLGQNLKDSVYGYRVHEQLYPSDVSYEDGFSRAIIEGLTNRGHNVTLSNSRAVENAIAVKSDGTLHAVADWRKSGGVSGY